MLLMRLLMDELVIQGEKDKRFIIDLNDSLQLAQYKRSCHETAITNCGTHG